MERGLLPPGHWLSGHCPPALMLRQRLQEATAEHLQRARPLLTGSGRLPPQVEVRFDLRGKAAGQVRWPTGREALIRYNLAMAQRQPEDFLAQTVPHEVAHVVCRALYPKARAHGPEWRGLMRFFGIERPARCHGFDTGPVFSHAQRRWGYRCDCRQHQLSTTRHYRIVRGRARYQCRHCGSELRPN